MKNLVTNFSLIILIYLLSICQVEHAMASPSNGNIERARNRPRGASGSRATQYGRIKPDAFANDFGYDDDLFDLSKRQQSNSDDYGHLRFGKRDEQFDDYGHMRFGRNGGETK